MSYYRTYTDCPAYTIMTMITDSQGRRRPADAPAGFPRWAGKDAPPALGTVVRATINGLGQGTVIGYFEEGNFLGLLVELHNAPDWHKRQRKGDPVAHIFGPEFEVVV
jgi:hypothetical protein